MMLRGNGFAASVRAGIAAAVANIENSNAIVKLQKSPRFSELLNDHGTPSGRMRYKMPELPDFADVSAEVSEALSKGAPVVALESTIITHGMPFPANADMASKVEAIIRREGAVPATIAVLEGRLKIGLSAPELAGLAKATGTMKLSRADLAFAIAAGRTGGTTVAATMLAAALAGIKVFATGGIGGVHRGAEQSFDISADLEEFARSPVIVVSAGAKAILDLEKTLEVLETKGVPVVTFGQHMFPAFWSASITSAVAAAAGHS